MTTSYLFAYYIMDSQVSLSSCMRIKTGLLFFLTFCCIITPILVLWIITVLWEIFKKSRENKNKLKTIYPKNHENFKNSKSKVQFYWFVNKKECTVIFTSVSAWCQSS